MWIDRRWRVAAITVSVLLNVFLVGIVAGHVFSLRALPRRFDGPLVRQANVKALPADERAHFRAKMKPHLDGIREARQAHRRARETVEADIAAPAFDVEKLTGDLATLRKADSTLQENANAALVDSLSTLSPESRAALVARKGRTPAP
jgi:uncharacterized membrane protein